MCGIAGYISTKPDDRLREIIQAMTDSVSHRGPDGEGVFVDGNVALGHRRLAIIDLSKLEAQRSGVCSLSSKLGFQSIG